MHTTVIKRLLAAVLLTGVAAVAHAKLPPATPEEQEKVAAAKAKAAADAEVEKQLLAKAQDRIAGRYIEEQRAKGITVTPTPMQAATPATAAAPATATAPAAPATPATNPGVTQEVPSAALNSRTTEKAGAYNESVTPQSAGGALGTGSQPPSSGTKQNTAPEGVQAPAKPAAK